jgi:hypothetical protein
MLIAQILNDQITIKEHTVLFPNTSFSNQGPLPDFMEENNCLYVTLTKEYNQDTEKLVRVEPYIENGRVCTVQVESLTADELQEKIDASAAQARIKRNQLLKDSDWTQGRDIQDSIAESWAIYRQALRDITAQEDFPQNITWPTPPGSDQE